jgi:hypothetical protein
VRAALREARDDDVFLGDEILDGHAHIPGRTKIKGSKSNLRTGSRSADFALASFMDSQWHRFDA